MFQSVNKLFSLFGRREKIRWLQLVFLTLVAAAMELLGIGVIFSFLTLVSTPEKMGNTAVGMLMDRMGIHLAGSDLIAYGSIGIIVLYFLKNAFLGFYVSVQARFIWNRFISLTDRVFREYLSSPYELFLQKKSSDILDYVRTLTLNITSGAIGSLTSIVADVVVACMILLFLIAVEPVISIAAVLSVVISLGMIHVYTKTRLKRNGEAIVSSSLAINSIIQQSIQGIKEVLLHGVQDVFRSEYNVATAEFAKAQRMYFVVSQYPRLVIEIAALIGLFVVGLVTIAMGKSQAEMIPIVGMFGMAVLRLMPTVSRLSSALNNFRYYLPTLDQLASELDLLAQYQKKQGDHFSDNPSHAVRLEHSVECRGVVFRYEGAERDTLRGISLNIKKGQKVGFVGTTGAGKSTLIDILLGLLIPSAGEVLVDGKNIAHNIREWQSVIGYVPQSIFLLDSTIRANIAFGVEDKEIDDRHLEHVIRQAQLHDFVRQLPEGLDTVVGERGIRLSGGQRQRIAIARALYRKPKVLVFDEATAALDNATEREIMSAVENLDKELTVLMIAHRLTTVEKCDAIYVMDNGKIHSHGRYEELLRSSDIFIQLANENTPYTISKS